MTDELTKEQIENIEEEIFAENKIQAIRLCREYTGWGLKESKDFVENRIRDLLETDPEKYGHLLSQGRSGCFAVFILLIGSTAGLFSLILY